MWYRRRFGAPSASHHQAGCVANVPLSVLHEHVAVLHLLGAQLHPLGAQILHSCQELGQRDHTV